MGDNYKLIVFDFDGVLTDNRVLVFEDGREAVWCSRSDGLGFDLFRRHSLRVLILSTEKHPVVAARAAKLKVPCLQGVDDKQNALLAFCLQERIDPQDVLYIGNDINDLRAMSVVGHRACPSDAHPGVKAVCEIVLQSRGGHGVAREVAETILKLV